jgi:putative ABC transport system permease protein
MQRVAIARALVNNPDIIMADEPTGALDSTTSVQIMELIKEIAKDKLVIMVTHNKEMADQYASRVIELKDGSVVKDSNPVNEQIDEELNYKLKKTSMSFLTALKLSFNNILTKKGRTILTAIASSIGIIGIAVILSLSTGFQTKIDEFQSDAMAEFPIIITQTTMNLNHDNIHNVQDERREETRAIQENLGEDELIVFDFDKYTIIHRNIFTEEYMEHINNIDSSIASSIGFVRLVNMNLIRRMDSEIIPITLGASARNQRWNYE